VNAQTLKPQKGDRVKPSETYGPAVGTVKWVSHDAMVCLVNWDDGSVCDHWLTSHLEVIL
jgi:hypothetical protein